MIGGDSIETLRAGGETTKDIPAADDNGDFDAQVMNILNLAGDALDDLGLDAESLVAHQRFAAELQQHPAIFRGFHD
jgi:hypothetical protein